MHAQQRGVLNLAAALMHATNQSKLRPLRPTTYLERTVEPNQLKQSGGMHAQATFQARVAGRMSSHPHCLM